MHEVSMSTPAEFAAYPSEIQPTMLHLYESLGEAIERFSALRAALAAGTYTRIDAAEDFESATMNDGFDVFSSLQALAEVECDSW